MDSVFPRKEKGEKWRVKQFTEFGVESHKSRSSLQELGHHGNHQVEQTNGFDEGETQNGVTEEGTTERWVAGNGVEESSEDETDTGTGTSETNGGRTHTNVLGDLDESVGDLRGVAAASLGLEGLAGDGGRDGALGGLEGIGSSEALALGTDGVGEGTLGDSSELAADGRASDAGRGHGGHSGGEHLGGHCVCVY